MPPLSEILPTALLALDDLIALLTLALHTAKALGALYTSSRDLYLFFTTQQWTSSNYIAYQFKYHILLPVKSLPLNVCLSTYILPLPLPPLDVGQCPKSPVIYYIFI